MITRERICLLLIVMALDSLFARADERIRVTLSVPKTDYLVAEPVSLTINWHNESRKPVEFSQRIAATFSTFYVSVDGGKLRQFSRRGGFGQPPNPAAESGRLHRTVQIPPTGSVSTIVFVTKGQYEGADEDFLLSHPGKYTLHANAEDNEGITINVALPTKETDKQALLMWKDRASAQFELAPEDTNPNLDALRSLATEFPESVYTQYARLGIAMQTLSQPHLSARPEPRKEAEVELNRVLQETRNPAVMEHAMFFKAWALAKSREEKRNLACELMRVHPKSGYLQAFHELGITCDE